MSHNIQVVSQLPELDAILAANQLVMVKFTAVWCGKFTGTIRAIQLIKNVVNWNRPLQNDYSSCGKAE